jgi:hypothetical protein
LILSTSVLGRLVTRTFSATCVAAFAFANQSNIMQFLEAYTVVYACGVAAVVLVIRGPIRRAYGVAGTPKVALR